jgi:hypothetical protein
MGIAFQCPQCRKRYQVPDRSAGTRLSCAHCGAEITVPAGTPAALRALKPRPVPRNPLLPPGTPSRLPSPAVNAPARTGRQPGAPVPSVPALGPAPSLPGGARPAPPPAFPPVLPDPEGSVSRRPPPAPEWSEPEIGAPSGDAPTNMDDTVAALSAMTAVESSARVPEHVPAHVPEHVVEQQASPPAAAPRDNGPVHEAPGTGADDLAALGSGRWSRPSQFGGASWTWYRGLDPDRPAHLAVLIVFCSVAAVTLITFAVLKGYHVIRDLRFNDAAAQARGRVVDLTWRGTEAGVVTRKTRFDLAYEYTVNGARYRGQVANLRASDLPHRVDPLEPAAIAAAVEVYYDPDDPAHASLGPKPTWGALPLPLAFGVLGIGFAVKALRHIRRARWQEFDYA